MLYTHKDFFKIEIYFKIIKIVPPTLNVEMKAALLATSFLLVSVQLFFVIQICYKKFLKFVF